MKVKRIICAVYMLSSVFLSGCWSSDEVSELAISVCIGIDKTENGYIISEQIVNPKAIAAKKATGESPVILYTGEGENIENTIENLSKQSSRRIYSAHLRIVVISEELAKEGIEDLVSYFLRSHEYRTDYYFVIAQGCSARDMLSVLTPEESIPGTEMFNKLALAAKEGASTREVRIIGLANSLEADGINPVIVGAEIVGENGKPVSFDDLKVSSGLAKIRYTSLGAFDGDMLSGWLTEDESKGYNFITNNVKHLSAYSDIGESLKITYDIDNVKSKIKGKVEKGKPSINVDIKFDYRLVEFIGELDLTKPENTKILNGMAENEVKGFCEAAVNKTQNELKTDIFGFGERLHDADSKYWKKVKGKWNSAYPDVPVTINVKASIKTTGEFLESISSKGKD